MVRASSPTQPAPRWRSMVSALGTPSPATRMAFSNIVRRYGVVGSIAVRSASSRPTPLHVNDRNQTILVQGVLKQVSLVRAALQPTDFRDARLHAVLCFVGAEWPVFFRRPLHLHGVTVVWPAALADLWTSRANSSRCRATRLPASWDRRSRAPVEVPTEREKSPPRAWRV